MPRPIEAEINRVGGQYPRRSQHILQNRGVEQRGGRQELPGDEAEDHVHDKVGDEQGQKHTVDRLVNAHRPDFKPAVEVGENKKQHGIGENHQIIAPELKDGFLVVALPAAYKGKDHREGQHDLAEQHYAPSEFLQQPHVFTVLPPQPGPSVP